MRKTFTPPPRAPSGDTPTIGKREFMQQYVLNRALARKDTLNGADAAEAALDAWNAIDKAALAAWNTAEGCK